MAKSVKFMAVSGGHVSVYVPWQSGPIEILEGEMVETDDKRAVEALRGSPEVAEIKEQREKKRSK